MSSFGTNVFTITQEEFNAFHAIDRRLFYRLVFDLGRDPGETVQVMALLLYLEDLTGSRKLIYDTLSWPDTIINALAEDAVACLLCAERDEFPFALDSDDISLLQSVTQDWITLQYIHQHRLTFLRAVARNVEEVCTRAFDDLIRQAIEENAAPVNAAPVMMRPPTNTFYGAAAAPVMRPMMPPAGPVMRPMMQPAVQPAYYYSPEVGARAAGPLGMGSQRAFLRHNVNAAGASTSRGGGATGVFHGHDPFDLVAQRQALNSELAEALSRLQLDSVHAPAPAPAAGNVEPRDDAQVPPTERSIFLTFSKGYPISEAEVIEFFTINFGACIDAIYMQDVTEGGQPLYARLVVPSLPKLYEILGIQLKAKFVINGKHVWARKYIHKGSKSPPDISPTSPGSPVT